MQIYLWLSVEWLDLDVWASVLLYTFNYWVDVAAWFAGNSAYKELLGKIWDRWRAQTSELNQSSVRSHYPKFVGTSRICT